MTQDDFLTLQDGRGGLFYLLGLHLPVLPDFLADHTLLGERPDERIREHARRWAQFVGGLWAERDVTYALRYAFDPAAGGIHLHLLARVSDAASLPSTRRDLQRALTAFGVHPEPVNRAGLHALWQQAGRALFEVRQRDGRLPTRMGSRGGETESYLVLPWWGPGGPFLVPMDALVSQPVPVTLTVLLRPTVLGTAERVYLARLAAEGRSAASAPRYIDDQRTFAVHQADPQSEWLGQTYAANLRRLECPFLVAAYTNSDDAGAARGVALALASMISEEQPFEVPLGESAPMQSRAEVVAHPNPEAALAAVRGLVFGPGPSPHVRPELVEEQRLRYLADARGAATAFRLPVSVRGGVPGIAVEQQPPDFHPGPRLKLGLDQRRKERLIALGAFHNGGSATVSLRELTKHALITGFTGSGKTRTLLHLLHQLWNDHHVPFLVLEPAKREYRGLLRVKKWQMRGPAGDDRRLRVYTLGNESCAPFRFNPFALLPGVRLEAHLGALQTCFEAAMPQIGPLPSILMEALERIYREDGGWLLNDAGPPAGQPSPLRFPTMSDLYAKVEAVIAERGYQGEVLGNLQAAVAGRIKPLKMGSKGRMFDTQQSIDPDELFTRPVVLEMNDLNEQDKSLVMMFLLTMLRQYRERNASPTNDLVHVTVLEEAHNVLENLTSRGASEVGNDLRAKAVQSFCNMLAEVRAYGEGLIIADQSPEKLAPDAMRNTNVQIAHQLRDGHDREAIANAMIMTDEQRDFLGKLKPGRAAVFYTGLQKASFVTVPRYDDPPADYVRQSEEEYRGEGYRSDTDEDLKRHMAPWTAGHTEPEVRFGEACAGCPNVCEYRKRMVGLCEGAAAARFEILYAGQQDDIISAATYDEGVARLTGELAEKAGHPGDRWAGWCAYLHLIHRGRSRRGIAVHKHRETAALWFEFVSQQRK